LLTATGGAGQVAESVAIALGANTNDAPGITHVNNNFVHKLLANFCCAHDFDFSLSFLRSAIARCKMCQKIDLIGCPISVK
jgi:hypothetical protein